MISAYCSEKFPSSHLLPLIWVWVSSSGVTQTFLSWAISTSADWWIPSQCGDTISPRPGSSPRPLSQLTPFPGKEEWLCPERLREFRGADPHPDASHTAANSSGESWSSQTEDGPSEPHLQKATMMSAAPRNVKPPPTNYASISCP